MSIEFGWRVPAFPSQEIGFEQHMAQIHHYLRRIEGQLDSAWVADHFIPWAEFAPNSWTTLESWTTLSHLSTLYPGLRFGSVVLSINYRHPPLLAKMAATLSAFSKGRFILGMGAGWMQEEYAAYGYEFPRASERIARLKEGIQLIRAMWTQAPATYKGDYYQIEGAYCIPQPDPPPPIMIGGGGERLTLRVVAEEADWWNFVPASVEEYAHKLDVLQRHCVEVGRDFKAIKKTWLTDVVAVAKTEREAREMAEASPYHGAWDELVGTPEQIVEQLQPYLAMDVSYAILRFADFPRTDSLDLFIEEVLPLLAE